MSVRPLTNCDAKDIATWRYLTRYSTYNVGAVKGQAFRGHTRYGAGPTRCGPRKQPGGTRHSFGVDTIYQVESLWGTRFNEILIGNDLNNHLGGGEGDDTLFGRGGNDRSNMYGADTFPRWLGERQLPRWEGNQTIRGGLGSDWIYYLDVDAYSVARRARVYLRRGIAKAQGTDRFAGIETVAGTRFVTS
jgi:hypothetical protein